MDIINTSNQMKSWSQSQRATGKRIAFVPTMGALHEGHVSLLKMGKKLGDTLILSIYVNPTQFGTNEDLEKYPRTLSDDLAKATAAGVDCVFTPTNEDIYPNGPKSEIDVGPISRVLCGRSRPGHFNGVATVVSKLFSIVEPSVAIFGEKDYQQLCIIRQMVKDLKLPVEIASHPTVREEDGLAMSSRNKYLSPEERRTALSISRALFQIKKLVEAGEIDSSKLIAAGKKIIDKLPPSPSPLPRGERARERVIFKLDYLNIVDALTLEDVSSVTRPSVACLAAYVGKTRLIDNVKVSA